MVSCAMLGIMHPVLFSHDDVSVMIQVSEEDVKGLVGGAAGKTLNRLVLDGWVLVYTHCINNIASSLHVDRRSTHHHAHCHAKISLIPAL